MSDIFLADEAVVNAVGRLLDSGAPQQVDWVSDWNKLSDDQLMAVLRRVLAVDAIKVAAVWAQVVTRLKSAILQNLLLKEVSEKITSIDEAALAQLISAPLDMQLTVLLSLEPLARLRPSPEHVWMQRVPAVELFVHALYQLDASGRSKLWGDINPKFSGVHGVLKYRAARAAMDMSDPESGIVSQWLQLKIESWLRAEGYRRGVVQIGAFRGRQVYVQPDDSRKYVLHHDVNDEGFNRGQEVVYSPSRGRVISRANGRKVVAVRFIPVFNSK